MEYNMEELATGGGLDMNSDFYPINWDEVENLDDLIAILKELEILIGEHADNFEELKPYLKIDEEE